MHEVFTQMAAGAVSSYTHMLEMLRIQADMGLRRGPISETVRNEAVSVSKSSARSFLSVFEDQLTDNVHTVAQRAYEQAQRDLQLTSSDLPSRLNKFLDEAVYSTTRTVAAQAERDVMAVAQYLTVAAQRIDLYVRSGRFNLTTATATIMLEDTNSPVFRFIDRLGRKFKATKHIRDTYRQHVLNVYNEIYMECLAEHGQDTAVVTHPDPNYKWYGVRLSIVGNDTGHPNYYDVRDEVFHPGSDATLTLEIA